MTEYPLGLYVAKQRPKTYNPPLSLLCWEQDVKDVRSSGPTRPTRLTFELGDDWSFGLSDIEERLREPIRHETVHMVGPDYPFLHAWAQQRGFQVWSTADEDAFQARWGSRNPYRRPEGYVEWRWVKPNK